MPDTFDAETFDSETFDASVTVIPGIVAIVITLFEPTVVAGGNTFLFPGPASITITTFAPSVLQNFRLTPGTLALTITLHAPFVVFTTPQDVPLPVIAIAMPTWPGRVLAELPSAYNVDYAWAQGESKPAMCSVKEDDPALTRNVRQPGNRVVITHPYFEAWVGWLVSLDKTLSSGAFDLQALDVLEILAGRTTPQDLAYTRPIGGGVVIKQLLDIANGSDTGIRAGNIAAGPPVSDLPLGGMGVLEAMRQVCGRTGYELWLTHTVTPNLIESRLQYGRRQGDDLRDKLHLYEGQHFVDANAKLDVSQVTQSRTLVGDFGMVVAERRSVTRGSFLRPGAGADIRARARRITNLLAGSSLADLPPAMRNESVHVDVTGQSITALDQREETEHEKMIESQAQFSDIVAMPSLSEQELRWLRVGNIWTRHGTFGEETEDVVRILSMQPYGERGDVELSCSAVLR